MEPHLPEHAQPRPRANPPFPPVDQDLSRRPGVPKERPPEPWPNAQPMPKRMTAKPAVPLHGRPNRQMPPVYSTAVPLRGISGLVKRLAYRLPDHATSHWLLLLLGDRVDSWTHRARKLLWIAAPAVVGAVLLRRAFEER
jgi:hypothetical protein